MTNNPRSLCPQRLRSTLILRGNIIYLACEANSSSSVRSCGQISCFSVEGNQCLCVAVRPPSVCAGTHYGAPITAQPRGERSPACQSPGSSLRCRRATAFLKEKNVFIVFTPLMWSARLDLRCPFIWAFEEARGAVDYVREEI